MLPGTVYGPMPSLGHDWLTQHGRVRVKRAHQSAKVLISKRRLCCLLQGRVRYVVDKVEQIRETSLMLESGATLPCDVLVNARGFLSQSAQLAFWVSLWVKRQTTRAGLALARIIMNV